jgi:hypothetical protein
MAYQKTQWKDHIEGVQVGTPVNAANMNKIEEGIARACAIGDTEGTWTPEVIEMLNSAGGCTYTSRSGHYIRIGKLTLVTFDIVVKTKPAGNNWNNYVQVCIKGMPGPLARQDQAYSMGAQVVLKAGDAPVAASTRLAYNTIAFTISTGALSTDKLGNGFELRGSIAYISS